MAPKLEWLQMRLDLDGEQLRKVARHVSVLSTSIDILESKLDWLQSRLDLDAAQLKKVVVALPSLLGMSVEDNVEPTLEWLQRRLDLDDAGLRKVVLGLRHCWA